MLLMRVSARSSHHPPPPALYQVRSRDDALFGSGMARVSPIEIRVLTSEWRGRRQLFCGGCRAEVEASQGRLVTCPTCREPLCLYR